MTAEDIQIEEMHDKRIKAEKVFYGRRKARRKTKATKEEGRTFNKITKKWEVPTSGEPLTEKDREAFRPPNQGDSPPKAILSPELEVEYKKYDERWTFFSFDENIAWHY